MHIWIIYKTRCTINGKIYIGQHKTAQINDGYLGSGKVISMAIKKYGRENFEREILSTASTAEEANILEEYWIKEFNSTNRSIGYNITTYAWGGQPCTPQTRKILSEKAKGKKKSPETILRMAKPKSQSAKENMKIAQRLAGEKKKGRIWYHDPITLNSKFFDKDGQPTGWIEGRPKNHMQLSQSKEANRKRSEKLSGRPIKEETKRKISDTLMHHAVSENTRVKISQSLKEYHNDQKTCIDKSC